MPVFDTPNSTLVETTNHPPSYAAVAQLEAARRPTSTGPLDLCNTSKWPPLEKLVYPSSTVIFPTKDRVPPDLYKFQRRNISHHTNNKRRRKRKRFRKSRNKQTNESTQQSKEIISEIYDKIELIVEEYLNQNFKNILLRHLNDQKVMEKLIHQSSQPNFKTPSHHHIIGNENHYKSSKIKKTQNSSPKHKASVRKKCQKTTIISNLPYLEKTSKFHFPVPVVAKKVSSHFPQIHNKYSPVSDLVRQECTGTENLEISSCRSPQICETNTTNSRYNYDTDPEIELDLDETTLQNISCAHSTYSPSHSDKQSIFSENNFSHNFTENDYSYYNMNSSQQASSSYGSETIYISSSDDENQHSDY